MQQHIAHDRGRYAPWIFSLVLHGILAAVLWHAETGPVRQVAPRLPPSQVRVKVLPAPATEPAPARFAVRGSGRVAKRPESAPRSGTAPTSGGPARPLQYADLLPGKDWQPAAADQATTDSGPAGIPPAQRAATTMLAGRFDIPLFFRETGRAAKAVAKMRRLSAEHWMFDYIDGDPLLRAVLFEALVDPQAAGDIAMLFATLGTDEFTISLRHTTSSTGTSREPFREVIAVQGSRIMIERILQEDARPPGGLSLPDREAERAKERDRGQLTRLRRSPAFTGPIRKRMMRF